MLFIYDDTLLNPHSARDTLATQIGDATLSLCEDASIGLAPRAHALPPHANAINHAGRVRSENETLFIWRGNRLIPLQKASDDDVERAATMISKARKQTPPLNGKKRP
jgi:hypothetical protein